MRARGATTTFVVAAFVALVITRAEGLAQAQSTPSAPATEQPEPTPDALAEARALFFEGVADQEKGRYESALARYARVRTTVVSPTLLFNIATCQERLGHLASAIATFEETLAAARAAHDVEVEAATRDRLVAAHRDVPHVVVKLAATTEDPVVTLDDASVARDSLEKISVDPGSHRLVVRSDRHTKTFELAFDIARRAERVVNVDLGPRVASDTPAVGERARAGDAPAAPVHRSYLPAVVAGGLALTFGAAAVVTGVAGRDKHDRYDELNARPSATTLGEREELRSAGTALYTSNAVLVGAAIVSAGVGVYFLVRPPQVGKAASSGRTWTPVIAVGPGLVGVSGAF